MSGRCGGYYTTAAPPPPSAVQLLQCSLQTLCLGMILNMRCTPARRRQWGAPPYTVLLYRPHPAQCTPAQTERIAPHPCAHPPTRAHTRRGRGAAEGMDACRCALRSRGVCNAARPRQHTRPPFPGGPPPTAPGHCYLAEAERAQGTGKGGIAAGGGGCEWCLGDPKKPKKQGGKAQLRQGGGWPPAPGWDPHLTVTRARADHGQTTRW
jgi:hypothetical protein